MIPILTGEWTSDEAKSSVSEEMMKCATEGNKYSTFDVTVELWRSLLSLESSTVTHR